jgi:hypothetical protein
MSRETFLTPEGFELPKRLILPDVRDFADLFEYVSEWDFQHMTGYDPDLRVVVSNVTIGPFLTAKLLPSGTRHMAIRPTPATQAALDGCWSTGTVSFDLIYHKNNDRVLVTAKENQMILSHYLAYIDLATIPAVPDEPAGQYAIKVDGEEIDHADTRPEAKRNRDTVIYGEIGTEANTTIEPRSVDTKRVGRTGVVWHSTAKDIEPRHAPMCTGTHAPGEPCSR